jgi:hypothetical protein
VKRLICLFGSHRRVGRSVWWDGYDFRSVCRRCGAPLYKHGNVRWRRVPAKRNKLLMLTHDGGAD